jgi:thiamine-phosphate pyrophosphorylase
MILLSPMFPTRSHPEWNAMPRMRAAALARLARRRAIALGGMNRSRFRKIQKLGFVGWAGIDAWVRT